MTTTATGVHIRWMYRGDHPQVLVIEEASFGPVARTEKDFLRFMRERNCISMVACPDGRDDSPVLGFMVYELFPHRFDLAALTVAPAARRRGVGTALVMKLVGKLSPWRRRRLTVTSRESMLGAHLFFRACGFRAMGVSRRHFDDTGEDGYQMRYDLPGYTPDTGGEG
jgi:ribosomal-protein-alanine N-acetyltransferase